MKSIIQFFLGLFGKKPAAFVPAVKIVEVLPVVEQEPTTTTSTSTTTTTTTPEIVVVKKKRNRRKKVKPVVEDSPLGIGA